MVPDEKRLTPERVKAAYRRIDATPIRKRWIDTRPVTPNTVAPLCCCGASAVYLDSMIGPECPRGVAVELLKDLRERGETRAIPLSLGVTTKYLDGFLAGFDGVDTISILRRRNDHPEYALGYDDGARSASALFSTTPANI